jgi:Asp-tRNA(Asn)/Glu-tRNA(Gln) amidotransferase A subunit family amidase
MLHRISVTELSGRLARREVSAVDALKACLDQVDRVDPQVKAFLSIDRADAQAQAEAADRALASGEAATRPLLGVPIA